MYEDEISDYEYGMKLFWSGKYEDAIEILNLSLQTEYLGKDGIYNVHCAKGYCYSSIGKYDEAIIELESALKLKDDASEIHNELGRVYLLQGDNIRALQQIDKAIKCDPNQAILWLNKGRILYELAMYDDAEKVLNTALTKTDSSKESKEIESIDQLLFTISLEKSLRKALDLQNDKKYEDANIILDSIVKQINNNSFTDSDQKINLIHAVSLQNKAVCLSALNRKDLAIEALNESIRLIPDSPIPYLNLAEHYIDLNNFDEASKYYNEAANLSEDESEKISIILKKHILINTEIISKKDYQATLDAANSIPETNDALICLKKLFIGKSLFYLGRYDEVLSNLLPYVDADWTDSFIEGISVQAMANTYIGGVYYKRKDYQTALKYLAKCVEIDYNMIGDAWLFMGECYIALGEYEKAIYALRKVVDAFDETDWYDIPYLESRIRFAKEKLKGSTQNEAEINICPKCGSKIGSEDIFCGKCGKQLK